MGFLKRLLKIMGSVVLGAVLLGWVAWAFGALWFDCPVAASIHAVTFAYLGVVLVLLFLLARGSNWAALGAVALTASVTLWWFAPETEQ